jgi:hypothetical protein
MAAPFDLEKLQLLRQPVPVVPDVMQATNINWGAWVTHAGQFSISDSGCLVYARGGIVEDLQNSFVWVDQRGVAQSIAPFKGPFMSPRLSPDGQRITCYTMGSEWRVWVFDLNRGTRNRLPGEPPTPSTSSR